jgi:hypothetical protein
MVKLFGKVDDKEFPAAIQTLGHSRHETSQSGN